VRKKEKESRQGAQESPYCEEGRKTEKELRRDNTVVVLSAGEVAYKHILNTSAHSHGSSTSQYLPCLFVDDISNARYRKQAYVENATSARDWHEMGVKLVSEMASQFEKVPISTWNLKEGASNNCFGNQQLFLYLLRETPFLCQSNCSYCVTINDWSIY